MTTSSDRSHDWAWNLTSSSLLKTTLAIEHRIADYFRPREGAGAVVGRVLATWVVLFGSKFIILEVVDIVLGDRVDLGGLIAFIMLVVVMLERVRLVVPWLVSWRVRLGTP
jgi:hypothetical protein